MWSRRRSPPTRRSAKRKFGTASAALYRSINDKIESLNETFGVVAETMAVICECGKLECSEQIELDIPTYEHVRADPTHFVVLPGHELLDVETVIERHDAFNIVRKDPGGPAEVARELAG